MKSGIAAPLTKQQCGRYVALAEMLLEVQPDLIHATTTPEHETALFAAARKGSLPHVQYFLSRGATVDEANHKGNTPLWCASFMQYPCIIEELLDAGADIGTANLKGNPCLYGPATRGSRKCAELLVSRGATVDHINANGDTLILICCRNGQQAVLEFLLSYVDNEFLNFKVSDHSALALSLDRYALLAYAATVWNILGCKWLTCPRAGAFSSHRA
jgi:ankyrin repeat protein